MNETYEKTLLLDYYGMLLSEKQKELCELAWLEDLSLSEISEQVGISRQGVRDALQKAYKTLEKFEEKLHLIEKNNELAGILDELRAQGTDPEALDKIHALFLD